jgi:hypothetical protein
MASFARRISFLTELAKDVDARTVQDVVGHSDVATTLRFYAHVLRSMRQRARAVFDEAKPATRPERSCGGERYPNHGFRLPGVVGGLVSFALHIGCTFRGKKTLGAQRLIARIPHRYAEQGRADERTRTANLLITSELSYFHRCFQMFQKPLT